MGKVFGGRAIELGGVVVRPAFQGRRIGTTLVRTYLQESSAKLLTAHTRNPRVLRLFADVCGGEHNVHPLSTSPSLVTLAAEIPGSSIENHAVYHINRYGNDGLYGDEDPASRPIAGALTLKQQFPALEHPGTALVVVGNIEGSIK